MSGEIEKGDLIISKKIPMKNLKTGDNIVFYNSDLKSNIVHKIAKIEYKQKNINVYPKQSKKYNEKLKSNSQNNKINYNNLNKNKQILFCDLNNNIYKLNNFKDKNNYTIKENNIIITTCAIFPEIKNDTNFVTQNNYLGKVIYHNNELGKIYLTISSPIFIIILFSIFTMSMFLHKRKLN